MSCCRSACLMSIHHPEILPINCAGVQRDAQQVGLSRLIAANDAQRRRLVMRSIVMVSNRLLRVSATRLRFRRLLPPTAVDEIVPRRSSFVYRCRVVDPTSAALNILGSTRTCNDDSTSSARRRPSTAARRRTGSEIAAGVRPARHRGLPVRQPLHHRAPRGVASAHKRPVGARACMP